MKHPQVHKNISTLGNMTLKDSTSSEFLLGGERDLSDTPCGTAREPAEERTEPGMRDAKVCGSNWGDQEWLLSWGSAEQKSSCLTSWVGEKWLFSQMCTLLFEGEEQPGSAR